ncbi:uncharacterized protein LOC130612376 [Hydractinia symbiolongicarpus]|uniref:uncharacterized protein LOC130612376 n=1 Tax=Hydractinia symbiolongicarpus TaxID=13093 RepID=UPI00254B1891|nr:uncharacterized protein LOC130612376 [Hydractinia symbiolongicarpus]
MHIYLSIYLPPSVHTPCQQKLLSQKTLSKRSKKLSKAEISKIKRERLPWTLEPLLPKIYGFDVFGIETIDPLPKHIFYGVPDEDIDRKWGEDRLRKYKNNKIRLQKMADARVFTKCHKPRNPDKIPIRYRETAEQYVHKVYNGIVWKDETEHKTQKMKNIPRIRHPVDSGSYPNNSVNENEMSSLHRYAWKGKYNKLTKRLLRLKDCREINLQDEVGR